MNRQCYWVIASGLWFEPTVIGCTKNFITFSYVPDENKLYAKGVVIFDIYNFVLQNILI
jgi:hypothetical protein